MGLFKGPLTCKHFIVFHSIFENSLNKIELKDNKFGDYIVSKILKGSP